MNDCKHGFESNEFLEYCAYGCCEHWAICKRDLKQIKKAYKDLKEAYKTEDRKIIHNSICWMIATCESVKPKLKKK